MFDRSYIAKWIGALAALLILLNLPGPVTRPVKGFFRNLITPVQHLLLKTGQGLKEGADTVRGFGGLAEENRRLSEEVIHLQTRLRVIENLDVENRTLRDALQFEKRQAGTLIPCEIAARDISGWWQSVRLSKGARAGVQPNRAVISSEGLVGRTAGVSAYTAEVLLLSDPACKVSARIARNGVVGLVSGRGVNLKGDPIARMRFIHKEVPLRVGDEVLTSGLGGVYPRNLLIGYIENIQISADGLYQTADLVLKAVVNLADAVFVDAGGEERP